MFGFIGFMVGLVSFVFGFMGFMFMGFLMGLVSFVFGFMGFMFMGFMVGLVSFVFGFMGFMVGLQCYVLLFGLFLTALATLKGPLWGLVCTFSRLLFGKLDSLKNCFCSTEKSPQN